MIYLYHLIEDEKVKYVGLTKNIEQRKAEHKRKKPKHNFILVEEFIDIKNATDQERIQIEIYNTYKDSECWNKSPGGDYLENSGYERKGIGGVKPKTKPWNAGKKGCFTEQTKKNWSVKRKNKVHSRKVSEKQEIEIIRLFKSSPEIELVGTISKNGKILTYERAFAKKYSDMYNITPAGLFRILKKYV